MGRPSPSSRASAVQLRCRVCARLFSRREHLERHERSHTNEKPFPCPTCRKTFSRADSLRRHQASHRPPGSAEAPSLAAGSGSRACRECAASRVRCPRGNPCRRCLAKNLPCDYPSSGTARKPLPRDAASAAAHAATAGDDDGPGLYLDEPVSAAVVRSVENPLTIADDEALTRMHVLSPAVATVESQRPAVSPPSPSIYPLPAAPHLPPYGYDPPVAPGVHHQALAQLNWLSAPAQDPFDWDFLEQIPSSFADVLRGPAPFSLAAADMGLGEPVPAPASSQTLGPPPPTQDGCVVQMSPAASARTASSPGASADGSSAATGGLIGPSPQTTSPRSSTGVYYVDGEGARAPFQGRPLRDRGSRAMATPPADDRDRIGVLDPDGRQTPFSAVGSETASNYRTLVEELARRGVDRASLPSQAYLDTCVRLYFARFHPIFPFVRGADLASGPHPWPLLLAVAAVGARYTNPQPDERVPYRDVLFDALHHALDHAFYVALLGLPEGGWSCLPRPAQSRDAQLPLLQAALLHVVAMLHSGNQALVTRAISARYYLVEACHRLQLLTSAEAGSKSPDETVDIGSWVQEESRLRVGYMIFILDFMFTHQCNLKGLMRVGDARSPLPFHVEAWETPTAEAVSSARSASVTLQEALEMLYMAKRLPPRPSEFATTVLIHAVIRQAREAAPQSVLWAWTPSSAAQARPRLESQRPPPPPGSDSIARWRNCACDCLDVLHWSANSKVAECAGWEHPTVLQLHLARFVLLTPVAHIQTLVGICTSSSTSSSSTASDPGPDTDRRRAAARSQVLQWAVHDQYKARLCLIHAGSVFWHVRHYSLDSVVEPFAIYMAVLVVWAYAVSMEFARRHGLSRAAATSQGPARTRAPGVPGSVSADAMDDAAAADDDDGLPEPSFIHLDRPCDDELVQTYVRLGDRMAGHMLHVGNITGPGAPKRILEEGVRLLVGAGAGAGEGAGQGHAAETRERTHIWGVEGEYADLLAKLINVTL